MTEKIYRYLVMVRSCDSVNIFHMKHLKEITISGDEITEILDFLYRDDRVIKGICMNVMFRSRRWKELEIRDDPNIMGHFDMTYGDTNLASDIASYVKSKISEYDLKKEILLCIGPMQTILLFNKDFEVMKYVGEDDRGQNKLQKVDKSKDLYCY